MARFVEIHYDELVERCRRKVAERPVPRPTPSELEHGIPVFLRQLAGRLAGGTPGSRAIRESAERHGGEMQLGGFTIAQVVHDYGDACQSIMELAIELDVPISTVDFRALNDCLDTAIADAVTEFERRRNLGATDAGATSADERVRRFAHEMQKFLHSATLAFDVLRSGGVGVRGSTGAVLSRSLAGMRDLVNNTLTDVRLSSGVRAREPVGVLGLIEEIEVDAVLEARYRGLRLKVVPPPADAVVLGDRQILASVISNLVQNALKFTRAGGEVTLRTATRLSRTLIEVEDECGGLPPGAAARMFPAPGPGEDARCGTASGLAIARRGAEALDAEIRVRDLPAKGCVFTLDLPRSSSA
jgi:signal transduction histidine kinase